MALIVEDNTGLPNAESYTSVDEFRAYWAARNTDTAEYDDATVEGALRTATQYIDGKWCYLASVLNPAQALEFPRANLTDRSGRTFNIVPPRVKAACNELAYLNITTGNLFSTFDHGGGVLSESIAGAVSITYAAGSEPGKLFEAAKALLQPYIDNPSRPQRPLPFYSTSAEPIFGLDKFDAPGTDDGEI